MQRPTGEDDEKHEAPSRHRQAQERPVDVAAIPRCGQHFTDDTRQRHRLQHEVHAGAARRNRRWKKLYPDVASRYSCTDRSSDQSQHPIGTPSERVPWRMQATEQEHDTQRSESDPLENAERTRQQPLHELHVQRIRDQSRADHETKQELGTKRPTRWIWIHGFTIAKTPEPVRGFETTQRFAYSAEASATCGRSTNSTYAIGALSPARNPHLSMRR